MNKEELQEVREYNYKIELLQQEKIRKAYQQKLTEELDTDTEKIPMELYELIVNAIHTVAMKTLGEREKGTGRHNIPISDKLRNLIEEKKRIYGKRLSKKRPETRG